MADVPPRSDAGRQQEMPFAVVEGRPITQLPLDLYIPPDALEVFLEAFEGPLDLLLYLIKRQNLDILEIRVAEITEQYLEYIDLMRESRMELAAEYLVMAAMLAEIKSRMLLPRPAPEESEEDDPRAELIRKLQEYERYKQAALDIDALERLNRDIFPGQAEAPSFEHPRPLPDVHMREMLIALGRVLKRAEQFRSHRIRLDPLSTRERMSAVLGELMKTGEQFVPFVSLFVASEGRAGVVVTFIAIMELLREQLIEIVQAASFSPIHVRMRNEEASA
jgi:segregation and condensation protein A